MDHTKQGGERSILLEHRPLLQHAEQGRVRIGVANEDLPRAQRTSAADRALG